MHTVRLLAVAGLAIVAVSSGGNAVAQDAAITFESPVVAVTGKDKVTRFYTQGMEIGQATGFKPVYGTGGKVGKVAPDADIKKIPPKILPYAIGTQDYDKYKIDKSQIINAKTSFAISR